MCSINHEKKAIFVRIPKTGGEYVEQVLCKFYGFRSYYLRRDDHNKFVGEECVQRANFLNLNKKGIYRYYYTSDNGNKWMNMDEEKWNSY